MQSVSLVFKDEYVFGLASGPYVVMCYALLNLLVLLNQRSIKSQTRRARELKFWDNVHTPQQVTCHMLHVTCHVSHVTCHVSCVTCHFFFFDKVVKHIGGRHGKRQLFYPSKVWAKNILPKKVRNLWQKVKCVWKQVWAK